MDITELEGILFLLVSTFVVVFGINELWKHR